MAGGILKILGIAVLVGWSVLSLRNPVSTVDARDQEIDRYPLPRNKATIEPCKQAALKVRPGTTTNFRVKNSTEGFRYRFEILDQARDKWAVICNPETMSIVETLKLD